MNDMTSACTLPLATYSCGNHAVTVNVPVMHSNWQKPVDQSMHHSSFTGRPQIAHITPHATHIHGVGLRIITSTCKTGVTTSELTKRNRIVTSFTAQHKFLLAYGMH